MSHKRQLITVIIIGALFLLIFLDSRGMIDGITHTGSIILSPLLRPVRTAAIRTVHFAELPFSYQMLSDSNRELMEENLALRVRVIQFREVARENEILRAALGVENREGFDFVFARVLYRDQQISGEYLLIDEGESRGIREGMAVISPSLAFVGAITRTVGDFSYVRFISDSSSVVSGMSQRSRILGSVKGELGTSLSFYFDAVPDSPLQEGEALITSGFEKGIPRGLVIGEVGAFSPRQDAVEQRAPILPYSDRVRLEEVFVITNTK